MTQADTRKLLVLGGSGFVGGTIVSYFNCPGTSFRQREGFLQCDARHIESLGRVVEKIEPGVVINCVGLANVDTAEKEPELARELNVGPVANLVHLQQQMNFTLVHISTDYVFSGELGMRRETDSTGPVNVYGRTKLDGEKEALLGQRSIILRISTPFGRGTGPAKKQFFEYVIGKLSEGEVVKAVEDQIVTSTYLPDLASAIDMLLNRDAEGIFHITSLDAVSRYEFAKKVATLKGLDAGLIEPVKMKDISGWLARRPRDTSLDVSLSRKYGVQYTPLGEALRNLLV